ncbi:10 kda heat shock protein [Globodera pallida]|uniref:10 kDa heat shock protein, mitochondrial n=1 Tax=Globodera pallida TaxID=36090 RepID=A0A183BRX7_GLOPA|nr:10 kda heat shock protein [Globodera pallida]
MLGRLSGMAVRSYSTDLKFRPFFDRVLIERFLPEQKTKGGIMIPEKAQGKVLEGTVVAVGPGFRNDDGKTIPMQLNVGDRVLLPEYGGSKLAFEDKEYHIFRESDIIGKFD